MKFHLRQAIHSDIPLLKVLIDSSVRGLQAQDYTPAQMESALKTVYGVDSQLIEDGTYFAAEVEKDEAPRMSGQSRPLIVGCGGWSKRKTLYGGDHWTGRHDELLDLRHDAARIRAFLFVQTGGVGESEVCFSRPAKKLRKPLALHGWKWERP